MQQTKQANAGITAANGQRQTQRPRTWNMQVGEDIFFCSFKTLISPAFPFFMFLLFPIELMMAKGNELLFLFSFFALIIFFLKPILSVNIIAFIYLRLIFVQILISRY